MSAPTICRACGLKIDKPDGKNLCDDCLKRLDVDLMWAAKLLFTQDELSELLKDP